MRTKFEELKIQMVMKLKKLTHREAVHEIARMNAAKRQAAEEAAEEAAVQAAERKARIEAYRARVNGKKTGQFEEARAVLFAAGP